MFVAPVHRQVRMHRAHLEGTASLLGLSWSRYIPEGTGRFQRHVLHLAQWVNRARGPSSKSAPTDLTSCRTPVTIEMHGVVYEFRSLGGHPSHGSAAADASVPAGS